MLSVYQCISILMELSEGLDQLPELSWLLYLYTLKLNDSPLFNVFTINTKRVYIIALKAMFILALFPAPQSSTFLKRWQRNEGVQREGERL